MALKDLLVVMDRSPAVEERLSVAISLALQHDAHLTGLFVVPPILMPGYVEIQIPEPILEENRKANLETAAVAEKLFSDATKAAAIKAEWRAVEGDPRDVASFQARYFDLTVAGQPTPGAEFDPAEPLIFGGGPVLLVPNNGAFEKTGGHVLIAWDGSREAARAVSGALPLFTPDTDLTTLEVDPDTKGALRLAGADISLHLARHALKVNATKATASGLDAGDVILNRASDLGADLIVMGAFGHSRLREFVLGGVTRHILHHMTVPVLMSH